MVQAIEENRFGNIEKLKRTIDLVLDTLGLPACDDIHVGRRMIREAVRNNRMFQENIGEIIKLASNIAYGKEDQSAEGSNHSIERQIEQIESIKSFVTQNPAVRRLDSEIIALNFEISLDGAELNSLRSEDIKLDNHYSLFRDFLYMEADGACKWLDDEDTGGVVQTQQNAEIAEEQDETGNLMPARMQQAQEQIVEEEEKKEEEFKDLQLDTIKEEILSIRSLESESESEEGPLDQEPEPDVNIQEEQIIEAEIVEEQE